VFGGLEDGVAAIINRRGYGARNDGLRLAIILRAHRERKPKQTLARRASPLFRREQFSYVLVGLKPKLENSGENFFQEGGQVQDLIVAGVKAEIRAFDKPVARL